MFNPQRSARLCRFYKGCTPTKRTFNERLTIEGIAPAPLTPEPDEAELAAEALLESLANPAQRSMFNPQLRKPAKGSKEYYRQLAERIRADHEQERRAALRYVAWCEQQLKNVQSSTLNSQSSMFNPQSSMFNAQSSTLNVPSLVAGLFKHQLAVEREGGELLRRWQHCLADITVLQMQAVADGEVKAAIEREENDARISYPEREQARPQVKSEKLKVKN